MLSSTLLMLSPINILLTLESVCFRIHKQACIVSSIQNHYEGGMLMKIEIETEEDGRWIAEVSDLPGVLVYGSTRAEAIARVEALALRVIADRLDHGESIPELDELFALSA
jgi:predicted RNase H-like HicB family nuclease